VWIDVKETFGAKGDGANDDSARIQAALDLATGQNEESDARNAVYFPGGEYLCRTTILLKDARSVRLLGSSGLSGTRLYIGEHDNPKHQAGAVLIWGGDPDQPLMRFENCADCSIENLGFVGGRAHRYIFSDATADELPGNGKIRFNIGTFGSIDKIFISTFDQYGYPVAAWLDNFDLGTNPAPRLTIVRQGVFCAFDITDVTSADGYRKIDVIPVFEHGIPSDNDAVNIDFIRNGASPEPFTFSDATTGDPASEYLRLNAANTEIAVSITTRGANHDVSKWLETVSNSQRVTIRTPTGSNSLEFDITGSPIASGDPVSYYRIPVALVGSIGTISDEDPVLLVTSGNQPVRDRAAALVELKSVYPGITRQTFFKGCWFWDGSVGIQMNTTTTGSNCADNTLVHCVFNYCGAGVRRVSEQVVNNAFLNCDFSSCQVGIDQDRGGDLRLRRNDVRG
jgi:hypothetical protein